MKKKIKAFICKYFEMCDSEDIVVLYKSLILVVIFLFGMVLFAISLS